MRSVLFILFVSIASTSFGQTKAYKKMLKEYYTDFPTISISDAYQHLKNDDALFLDIRQSEEYKVSHIRGAKKILPDMGDKELLLRLKNVDKNATIIVYCSVGARSQDMGEKLKANGFKNVKNLYGGLFLWTNRKYPMVNNNGDRTTTIHGFSKEWGKWITNGKVVY